MKKPFWDLTKDDVEFLRRRTAIGTASYNVSQEDLENALRHLQTLYEGRVTRRFATTIVLLHELFWQDLCKNTVY